MIDRPHAAGDVAFTAGRFLGSSAAAAEPPPSSVTVDPGASDTGHVLSGERRIPLLRNATGAAPPVGDLRVSGAMTTSSSCPTAHAIATFDCIRASVHYRDLTTRAAGAAEVRRVPLDDSGPIASEDRLPIHPGDRVHRQRTGGV